MNLIGSGARYVRYLAISVKSAGRAPTIIVSRCNG